ncbi:MAG: sugar ABC transporter substrate-binding protein [Clostridiales bacterium]|nr:sugar ABC transporter substrate-binding protein [Clostridiales bacterium]
MKNTRKLLALLLALAMCLGLAACGGSSDEDTDDSGSASSTADDSSTEEGGDSSSAEETGNDDSGSAEEVTITWALWDYDSTAYWSALKEGYESTHEGVTIEVIDLGSTDYMTQLATQLAGGNSELDVVSIKDIPGYSNLINLGLLEAMNDNLAIDEADFNGVLEQLTADDGNYYAVPFRSDFWVLYYNKDIFDAAGIDYPTNDMTMEEYDALARELTSGEGSEKIYGTHYHTWRSDVTLFGILDGEHTIIDGEYDFLTDYYNLVLSEQEDGICMDYGELKTSGLHYSAAFENGQAAMCPMGSWFIATLQTYNSEAEANGVDEVNFGIVKYPHPDGVEAGTTLGTVTSLGVNTNSENKEAAIDFVNWCASSEGADIMASTGSFPAVSTDDTVSIISATEGFPSDESSLEALNTVAVYLEMPLSSYASEIETILNTEHDAIMTGAETVEEGIANMNEQVQAILADGE